MCGSMLVRTAILYTTSAVDIDLTDSARYQIDIDFLIAQGPPSGNQARRSLRRYTSRCHVHDVCRVLHASMLQPQPGSFLSLILWAPLCFNTVPGQFIVAFITATFS